MFQRGDEIHIHVLHFLAHLFEEHLLLNNGVVLFGVSRCDFLPVDAQLKDVNRAGVILRDLGERTQLPRYVRHKGGLNQGRLNEFFKDIVGDFVILQYSVHFNFHGTGFFEFHLAAVAEPVGIPGRLHDQILILRLAPFTGEVDHGAVGARNLQAPNHALCNVLDQALREGHHAAKIRVCLVEFEHRELGVVPARQAFIAEDPPDFKNPFLAAHQESFQIQLQRNAHIKGAIERVKMRLKGPRRCAARHALQDRRFHLREIALPKVFPHRLDDAGTLPEALPRVGVYDQIEITLAVNFLVV